MTITTQSPRCGSTGDRLLGHHWPPRPRTDPGPRPAPDASAAHGGRGTGRWTRIVGPDACRPPSMSLTDGPPQAAPDRPRPDLAFHFDVTLSESEGRCLAAWSW